MGNVVLEAKEVTKHFGGVRALTGMSLQVAEGEVVGLVGENGAGKSTLLSVLSGSLQPDSGQVAVNGVDLELSSYVEANQLGIFRAHQDQGLLANMTIADNLYLGHESRFAAAGILRRRKMIEAARRQLADDRRFRKVSVLTKVSELPLDLRQLVEIARGFALAELLDTGKPVILLDESTASLNHDEVADLFEHIRDRRGDASFIFVSHRLQEVLEICDRVYVMKDGEPVAELETAKTDEESLHSLMVGRERDEQHYREDLARAEFGSTRLVLDKLSSEPDFRNVSLSVREGEILAVGGVTGSGKSLLARSVAGDYPISSGTIEVDGKPLVGKTPGSRLGTIAYGPIDRHEEGVSLGQTIRLNTTLSSLRRFTRGGLLRKSAEVKHVKKTIDEYSIVPRDAEARVGELSGGNQQKVMLARLVDSAAKVIVFDNPTRGVDAGAREEIYLHLRRLAEEKMAILMISDDLRELIGLGDRVAVLKDGEVTHIWDDTTNLTEQDVVAEMV